MFSMMRRRLHLSPSMAIAFVALVFALTGASFAAGTNGGNGGHGTTATAAKSKAKAKGKAGPRGPAGPQGKTGPAGATGPTGATGAQGPQGGIGPQGTAGAKGETGEAGPKGETGSPGAPGAAGAQGEPWSPNSQLPSGATETGTWTAQLGEGEVRWVPLSFPVQLAGELEAAAVHIAPNAACPGTAKEPKATPGNLCVYVGLNAGSKVKATGIFNPAMTASPTPGAASGGAVLLVNSSESGALAFGTWAVTAK